MGAPSGTSDDNIGVQLMHTDHGLCCMVFGAIPFVKYFVSDDTSGKRSLKQNSRIYQSGRIFLMFGDMENHWRYFASLSCSLKHGFIRWCTCADALKF